MKIVNCTPHVIVETITGTAFAPSGNVARVSSSSTPSGDIAGIPCFATTFGEVHDLPAPQEGVVFIVSGMVLDTCRGHRSDLVAPGELVRDSAGNPVGCKGFRCKFHKPPTTTMKTTTIQSIEISEDNFVLIQGTAGEYEALVWSSGSDSEGDDGSRAISRTCLAEISDELSDRADIDNSI